jgi:two-component system, cell cycle response regulator
MKVLVADDSAAARAMLQRTLGTLGHDCTVAVDGASAWELFERTGADVVISDWMMPGMTGDEFCRLVRGGTRQSYTYFILLTSLEDQEHVVQGMEAGADDYLKKPFDLADLQARLISAERVTALYAKLNSQQAELEDLNRRLFAESRTDPLTHIGNRMAMDADLVQLSARASRYGHWYCLTLFDIDKFKAFNDSRGHLAGDQVLKVVASTLADACRSGDAIYRYGGEELLVVLPEQSLESANVAAERMRAAIEALAIPHTACGPGAVVTVSGGLARLEERDGSDFDAVLKRADEALYRAKELGRNRVEIDSAATAAS